MPNIKIFLSVKYFWCCLTDLLNRFVFSIKWSDVKKIKGWFSGISFINAEQSIAGAVFLFAGSRIILYFLKIYFSLLLNHIKQTRHPSKPQPGQCFQSECHSSLEMLHHFAWSRIEWKFLVPVGRLRLIIIWKLVPT